MQVTQRVTELAQARYMNKMKKKIGGRKAKIPKFDPAKANIPEYPDCTDDGTEIRYALHPALALAKRTR